MVIPVHVFVCMEEYTFMDKVLLCSGVTMVSRKGLKPFDLVSSTVNLIAWCMVLIWCRKIPLIFNVLYYKSAVYITLPCCSEGHFLKLFYVATIRLTGDPIPALSTCS